MKTINERVKTIGNTRSAAGVKVRFAGLAVTLVGILMFGSGCAHTLEIKNINSYDKAQTHPLQRALTIGVVPSTDDVGSHQLMKGIESALGRYSTTVVLPDSTGTTNKADVVAKIKIQSEYKGSGWNFLINFPGFLIFTPAWNGYVYKANYNVDIKLAKGVDDRQLVAWALPINLDLRQAEFDRTWTEISWLEVGAIAFIGGIVFTGYDTDVTPILGEAIKNPIGDYIAQDIVNHINSCTNLALSAPPAAATPVTTSPAVAPPVAAPPAAMPSNEPPPAATSPAEPAPAATPSTSAPPAEVH
jgi:hypothetical protein